MFCYQEASKGRQQKGKQETMTTQCKCDCTSRGHEVPTLWQMLYYRVSLIYLKFQNPAKWILSQLLSVPQRDIPIYYLYLRFQMSELFKQSEFIKYVANKSKKANGEEKIEAAERCQNIINQVLPTPSWDNWTYANILSDTYPTRCISKRSWLRKSLKQSSVFPTKSSMQSRLASPEMSFPFPLKAFLDYRINSNLAGNGLTSSCTQGCNVLQLFTVLLQRQKAAGLRKGSSDNTW